MMQTVSSSLEQMGGISKEPQETVGGKDVDRPMDYWFSRTLG